MAPRRIDLKWLIIGVSVLIVSYLALVPLGFLVWQSFLTPQTVTAPVRFALDNCITAYSSTETFKLFLSSMKFAIGS